jgi:small subunit ribosomal protein S20
MHIGHARSEVKKARTAIASGDLAAATEAVNLAASWLDHAATKGSIHPNNAARRKGRLMAQLARMEARPVSAPVAEVEEAPAKPAKAARASKPKAEKPAKEEKAPRSRAKKSKEA